MQGFRARRVVERTHSWINRFIRLLIKWEKKTENYLAILIRMRMDNIQSNKTFRIGPKQVYPVAWQHINFYGRYEFNKRVEFINMETIIYELAELQVTEC